MSEYPGDNDAASLKPCVFCGRKFAADRIAKHEGVCTKSDGSKLKSPTKTLNELKPPGSMNKMGGGGGSSA